MRHTRILYTLLLLLPLAILTSCSNEDDINEIFVGRTFYFRSAKINGVQLNSDVKEFYQADNTYCISFTSGTFSGTMAKDTHISGHWSADGSSNEFRMTFNNSEGINSSSELCQKLYNILKNATRYSGDSKIITIYKDNANSILLSSSKNH